MSLKLTRRHNVDRFGYLIPTQYGNVPMVGAVATYRPGEGHFGGAVAVEEGTTNLYSNPFFRDGITGWGQSNWSGGGTAYVEAMKTPVGNSAMIMDNAGATAYLALYQHVALPDAVSNYTVSLLVKNLSSQPCTVQVYMGTSYYTIGTMGPGDGWVRLTRTYVAGEYTQSSFHHFRIFERQKVAIAAIQLEQKPFATSFVDGTRPDGILAYPISIADNYTIACYRKSHTDEDYKHVVKRSDGKVFVDGVEDSGYDVGWIGGRNLLKNSDFSNGLTGWTVASSSIVSIVDDNDFYKVCKVEASGGNQGIFGRPTTGALTAGETYTLSAMVKADDEMSIGVAIDGSGLSSGMTKTIGTSWEKVVFTKVSSGNNTQPRIYSNSAGTFYIAWVKVEKGSKATDWTPAPEDLGYDGDALMLSNQTGLVDELLILPYAASEEEIVSWYEAQGPLPPHPQASLQWDRQAVRPAQMVKL